MCYKDFDYRNYFWRIEINLVSRLHLDCSKVSNRLGSAMTFRLCLTFLCVLCSGFLPLHESQSAPHQPNVILIFIDDMGYGDVGFNGETIPKTPNLDTMAADGMVFDDFYVGCAVCSGSRTALLTGTHYQRVSMSPVLFPRSDEGLHPDEVTIADMLKDAG